MKGYLKPRMKAFVRNNGDLSLMDVQRWADENECGCEDVREAYESEMTKHSTKPQNTYGAGEVDGK